MANYYLEYMLERLRLVVQTYYTIGRHGRYRSLIRLVGSTLGLKTSPRLRLIQNLKKSKLNAKDESSMEDMSHPKPDFLLDLELSLPNNMSPKNNCGRKEIIDLQKQVNDLHNLVNQIMLRQSKNRQSTEDETKVAVPPPPPPLPPLVLSTVQIILPKKMSNNNQMKPKEQILNNIPSMGEVLKDLNKIKLRHVERSPGGRPIKQQNIPSSPTNCLTAVLKKRFAAMQTKFDDIEETDSDFEESSFQSLKIEASL